MSTKATGQGHQFVTSQGQGMSMSSMQTRDELDLDAEYHSDNSQATLESHRRLKPRSSDVEFSSESFEMSDISEPAKHSSFPSDFEGEECERGSDEESPVEFSPGRLDSKPIGENFELYTPDEEKSVIKTFDRRLVLFIAFLYMLSFLDRSSAYFLLFGRLPLMTEVRYWERKDSWVISRFGADLQPIRMALKIFLYHIHFV